MTRCEQHPHGSPLCLIQDADTFTGRVELRDGPDFGHVYGSWSEPAADVRQIIGDLAALLGAGIVVAAFIWAIFVLLAAMA